MCLTELIVVRTPSWVGLVPWSISLNKVIASVMGTCHAMTCGLLYMILFPSGSGNLILLMPF